MWCAPCANSVRRLGIAFLADVHLRVDLPRVPSSGLQTQVTAYVPAFTKSLRIFPGQQVGERDQRAHSLHLSQSRHLRITFLRQRFGPFVALNDAFTQRLDRGQQRLQCALQFRTQPLRFLRIHIARVAPAL
jgi:hypothetical protein